MEGESGGVRVVGGNGLVKIVVFFVEDSYNGCKMGLAANKLSIEIQTSKELKKYVILISSCFTFLFPLTGPRVFLTCFTKIDL